MATYVVTGGAGFIGSNVVAALETRGEDVIVIDWLGKKSKWQNLAKRRLLDLAPPEQLFERLDSLPEPPTAIFHFGAISDTTETDVDLIVRNNVRATFDLLDWCSESATPLIYASSAATYGDGESGFDDEFGVEALARLRPLNAYGWSKQVVDRRIARLVQQGARLPPQWVGLKFFNVYGPNEYHKGTMQSVVARNFASVRAGEPMRLFRSYRPEYADGGQLRDFIYVKNCVDVMLWLLEHPKISGLFNVGTGLARTWLDLAHALLQACGREPAVEFVEMPPTLIHKYQYFTQARMERLRRAGYERPFTSLEDGVTEYVQRYLSAPDPYR
jgi:ADP-L-glycero-D-manno-heptose 6-epimerase